jgi:hypothetical protein
LTTTGQPADSDRADRDLPAPQFGTGRGRRGVRRVDDHAEEGAFVDDVREKTELVGDAGELAREPGHAERRLRLGGFNQVRRARLNAISGSAQQRRSGNPVRQRVEGRVSGADGRVHRGGVSLGANLRADFAGTRITAKDGFHAHALLLLTLTLGFRPRTTTPQRPLLLPGRRGRGG